MEKINQIPYIKKPDIKFYLQELVPRNSPSECVTSAHVSVLRDLTEMTCGIKGLQ